MPRIEPSFSLAMVMPVLMLACATESPTRTVSPPLSGGASDGASTQAPIAAMPMATPMDEARRDFEAAEQTGEPREPRERCRLLRDAVTLDQTLMVARKGYASSRCAPASELLEHARWVFAQEPTAASAANLALVATRAGKGEDATAGARALAELSQGDLEQLRFAARTLARFSDHAAAARIFERIASERASKGSSHDALDARLDAAMESARALGKGGTVSPRADLLATIDAAVPLSVGYGGAWIAPKVIEAIAVLRVSGDLAGASDAARAAREKKLVQTPETKLLLDLERAIAAARAGNVASLQQLEKLAKEERRASRVSVAASRALLAVEARLSKKCGAARAYARAQAAIAEGTFPRFDDDVAWARTCEGGERVATLARPKGDDALDDLDAVAAIDPVRGRGLLQAYVEAHAEDPAARLSLSRLLPVGEALTVLDAGIKVTPEEPWLHFARIDRLTGAPRESEANQIAKLVLPTTIEVADDPRAAAPVLVELLFGDATDTAALPLSLALVRACAAPPHALRCLADPKAANGKSDAAATNGAGDPLVEAAHRLRLVPSMELGLAQYGPALADADLVSAVRLDVVIALLDGKQIAKAQLLAGPSRGKWDGVEAALAEALIAGAAGNCAMARAKLAQWPGLSIDKVHASEVARVKSACNLPP